MQGALSPKKTGTNKVRPCLRFNYVSDVKSYLAVIITLEHLFSMSLVSVALPCDKANDRYKNKSEKHRKCACVDRRGKVYAPKCSSGTPSSLWIRFAFFMEYGVSSPRYLAE